MHNWRIHLVKGALVMDDLPSTLQIRGNHARWGMDPLMWRNVCAQQHLVKQPFLARLGVRMLRREYRISSYP